MNERRCPRCGTALRQVEDGRLVLDTCPTCGGLWIDEDEWKPLVGSVRSIARPLSVPLDFRRPPCPACGPENEEAGLMPRGLRGGGELEIDLCASCGGAWLDAGELEHARVAARLLGEERRRLAAEHEERECAAGRRPPSEPEQRLLDSLVEAWHRLLGRRGALLECAGAELSLTRCGRAPA